MRLRPNLKDIVYGANDGIITTFAVVSGVVGAALPTRVIIVIGLASLLADGVSMAASNDLAGRSEEAVTDPERRQARPSLRLAALATLTAFVVVGAMPLVPYMISWRRPEGLFPYAALATGVTLFVVGALRSWVTRRGFFRSGVKMLLIGGAAAFLAWAIARGLGALGI